MVKVTGVEAPALDTDTTTESSFSTFSPFSVETVCENAGMACRRSAAMAAEKEKPRISYTLCKGHAKTAFETSIPYGGIDRVRFIGCFSTGLTASTPAFI